MYAIIDFIRRRIRRHTRPSPQSPIKRRLRARAHSDQPMDEELLTAGFAQLGDVVQGYAITHQSSRTNTSTATISTEAVTAVRTSGSSTTSNASSGFFWQCCNHGQTVCPPATATRGTASHAASRTTASCSPGPHRNRKRIARVSHAGSARPLLLRNRYCSATAPVPLPYCYCCRTTTATASVPLPYCFRTERIARVPHARSARLLPYRCRTAAVPLPYHDRNRTTTAPAVQGHLLLGISSSIQSVSRGFYNSLSSQFCLVQEDRRQVCTKPHLLHPRRGEGFKR